MAIIQSYCGAELQAQHFSHQWRCKHLFRKGIWWFLLWYQWLYSMPPNAYFKLFMCKPANHFPFLRKLAHIGFVNEEIKLKWISKSYFKWKFFISVLCRHEANVCNYAKGIILVSLLLNTTLQHLQTGCNYRRQNT